MGRNSEFDWYVHYVAVVSAFCDGPIRADTARWRDTFCHAAGEFSENQLKACGFSAIIRHISSLCFQERTGWSAGATWDRRSRHL